ncbi:MAG: FkbM family methyltransferase [Blastocatellales bacterium]
MPVGVTTVDSFLDSNRLGKVDLVKIDTETTEPQVLAGMKNTLLNDRPSLICEVLCGFEVEKQLESILNRSGYSFFHLTSGGIQRVSKIKGHPEWLNYLFIPEEKADALIGELRQQIR